jgi:hypothetical protein
MPEKRLFAPMLSTFGGGSIRGFGGPVTGGAGGTLYDFTVTTTSSVKTATLDIVPGNSTGGYSSGNGYEDGTQSITITGAHSATASTHAFYGRNNPYYLKLTYNASNLPASTQYVTVEGCRGGNHNDGTLGMVYGGDGSTIKAQIDFSALHNQYAISGNLILIAIMGTRGVDIVTPASSRGTAAGGGGASALAVYTSGGAYVPLIVAAGGGGAYGERNNTDYYPAERPGGDAWLPSSNYTNYQQYTYWYTTVGWPNVGNITSNERPWSDEGHDGTGSANGASWEYNGQGYSSTNSYGAETLKLKDIFKATQASITDTPWRQNQQITGDPTNNSATIGTWMGGGGGAYGGGGAGGYFGGFHGAYDGGNPAQYGRAAGGQGYIDTTYVTLTSHTNNTNALGKMSLSST